MIMPELISLMCNWVS